MKHRRQAWTKEEIKTIIKMWSTKSTDDICKELGLQRSQVSYIANAIRNTGYKLPKKHRVGYINNLVKEAIAELK